MNKNLDPTYVGYELLESVGVHETGWYLIDDNFKVADGPFATKEAAQERADRLAS